MKFNTQYTACIKPKANPGSPEHLLFSPEFDSKGIMTLKETGKENLYDYIQSHRDSVDIHKIIKRFEEGDVTALSKIQGQFGDFSAYPRNYAELLNQVLEGERSFNQLPMEIRESYGFSYERWLSDAGSENWNKTMGLKPPEPVPAPAPSEPTVPLSGT